MKVKALSLAMLVFFAAQNAAAAPVTPPAASPTPQPSPTSTQLRDTIKDSPTTIDADTLVLNMQSRQFEYSGNVKVHHGDMKLSSEKLQGSYSADNQIETLLAVKDVVIEKPDGTCAKSQKAEYDAKSETVMLTDNPEITQGESILSADKIKVYLNEDRSEALGQVRVRMAKKPGAPESQQDPTAMLR